MMTRRLVVSSMSEKVLHSAAYGTGSPGFQSGYGSLALDVSLVCTSLRTLATTSGFSSSSSSSFSASASEAVDVADSSSSLGDSSGIAAFFRAGAEGETVSEVEFCFTTGFAGGGASSIASSSSSSSMMFRDFLGLLAAGCASPTSSSSAVSVFTVAGFEVILDPLTGDRTRFLLSAA